VKKKKKRNLASVEASNTTRNESRWSVRSEELQKPTPQMAMFASWSGVCRREKNTATGFVEGGSGEC
jgi:hypothetical protein